MDSNQRPKKVPPLQEGQMFSNLKQNAIVALMVIIATGMVFSTVRL